jgi:hypothetical protein
MAVTIGLQLPFGIQPVNPVPVDSWSGPFTGSIDTVESAKISANASIPAAIRFQSMEVRLIVSGTSRKFWYRDGIADADLVEFASGGSSGTPGGSSSHIQFNDSGVFGGSPNLTFNSTTSTLSTQNLTGSLTRLSDGSSYLVAGDNISITTGSTGQITIASTSPVSVPRAEMMWMETPSGDTDGVNMVFALSQTPNPKNSLMFFVNGVLQKQGPTLDYMLDDNTVTMLNAPNNYSNISATYTYQLTPAAGDNIAWAETPEGDADGYNSVFNLQHTPFPTTALMFYVNGVLQVQGVDYDFLLSGNTVIFSISPGSGSNLTATYPY